MHQGCRWPGRDHSRSKALCRQQVVRGGRGPRRRRKFVHFGTDYKKSARIVRTLKLILLTKMVRFLLARLHLDSVLECKTRKKRRIRVESLSKELDKAYGDEMRRIKANRKHYEIAKRA